MNYNPLVSDLIEIFDGYTKFDFNGVKLYLRHFSIRDQSLIADSYEKFKTLAEKKGLESEFQIFERLKADGTWTENDDLKIAELQNYIDNLKKSKDKIFLPSQKDEHQKLIDSEESSLNLLLAKKKELVGISCEEFALKRSNEEFLRFLIYDSKNLVDHNFTEQRFGELNNEEIYLLNNKYFEISNKFSDKQIQKIVLQDFFNMYLSVCENPQAFFGKNICNLSAYQMKLLLYGKIFNNIFQYHDDIPNDIKQDPEEIFKFIDLKKTRDQYQNSAKENSTSVIFGATKKDLEILDPEAKKISLSEEILKNGGSLNMEQMIQLMNQ